MISCTFDCPYKRTGTCYSTHGCRCEVCRAANAARARNRKKNRDPSTLPPEKHGEANTYKNWNCRCTPCKNAWADVSRDYYHRAKARKSGEA